MWDKRINLALKVKECLNLIYKSYLNYVYNEKHLKMLLIPLKIKVE